MGAIALQLGGSLVAILLVSWLVRALGLGGDVRLRSEVEVRELARTAICAFDPVDIAIDRAGIGALLRDGAGRILLVRRHGVNFVARLLTSHHGSRLDRNFLTIDSGERMFGAVTLDLGSEAPVWAGSLRRLAGSTW